MGYGIGIRFIVAPVDDHSVRHLLSVLLPLYEPDPFGSIVNSICYLNDATGEILRPFGAVSVALASWDRVEPGNVLAQYDLQPPGVDDNPDFTGPRITYVAPLALVAVDARITGPELEATEEGRWFVLYDPGQLPTVEHVNCWLRSAEMLTRLLIPESFHEGVECELINTEPISMKDEGVTTDGRLISLTRGYAPEDTDGAVLTMKQFNERIEELRRLFGDANEGSP